MADDLARDPDEHWLQMANETARSQGASLFQLRAMVDLARKQNQPLGPLTTGCRDEHDSFDLEQLPPDDRSDLQDLNPDSNCK